MDITARCHPLLDPLLPKPVPAGQLLPEWIKSMPGEVAAASLGGADVRTLKHCPPMIDAMRLGVLILCPTDITVQDNEVSWDWDPPILTDADISRAPVGVHVPEQAAGTPLAQERLILKFVNYWTLQSAPGWSLMFHHPVGFDDLPFKTLSGVVDCDVFKDGYVHFPALLDPEFSGVIRRGTPIAQVVPVQKETVLRMAPMSEAEIAQNRSVQQALGAQKGAYRKNYRR